MSEAKIEIKIGQIEFSGQGQQEWVAKQLDKILSKAEDLITLSTPPPEQPSDSTQPKPMGKDTAIAGKTLPSFLSDKNATRSQVKKFLATAVWLEAKGNKRLTTGDVTKALKDSNQSRLSNPSDCLNKNVTKGFCEKDGREFFVTQEGKKSL
ncbi:MAG: hypothetical protein JRI67_11880 [Deltaproteobacteria bacterium]|nr:hypothetical protein [Deltaproteobacteria bacterium]